MLGCDIVAVPYSVINVSEELDATIYRTHMKGTVDITSIRNHSSAHSGGSGSFERSRYCVMFPGLPAEPVWCISLVRWKGC
jgi:hypothetical protein